MAAKLPRRLRGPMVSHRVNPSAVCAKSKLSEAFSESRKAFLRAPRLEL